MIIRLERVYLPTETLGSIYGPFGENGSEKLLVKSMELPWLNNRRGVSCFPEGIYDVTKEPPIPKNDPSGRHERPYWHFRLPKVPGRSGILMHKITMVKDLKGCIGVGSSFQHLNSDGIPDMIGSTLALEYLVRILPDKFQIQIVKKP